MSNQIELETIAQDHHLVMGEHLIALRKNPHFIAVIVDGYLKEKVLASVSLLGHPAISEQGKRPGVMEDLISASNLQFFFNQIDGFYEGAKNPTLSDDEEAAIEAQGGIN